MKKLLLFLTCLLTSVIVYSQITFQRHYSFTNYEIGSSVLQTNDGGYIIAGSTGNTAGSGFILRTNEYGDTLWSRAYGGIYSHVFYSIDNANDSGYILCGVTHGLVYYGYNYLFLKIDSNGDTLWQKVFGGYGDEDANCAIPTSDGGYAVAGVSCSFGQGFSSIYFVKTNSNGDTLWTKAYDRFWANYGWDIKQLDDNGYIILGTIKKISSGDDWDINVIRTNENGDTLWTKTYGGTARDCASSIQKTNDGGFIIFGSTKSFGAGGFDAYVIKINSTGIVQWSKTYGGINDDNAAEGITTNDNGFAFIGTTNCYGAGGNDVYLVKTNSSGDTLWTRTFDSDWDDYGCSIKETYDEGFIIAGWSYRQYPTIYNAYLIKTNASGHVVGIDDYNKSLNDRIIVYPNPTTGKVNIQISKHFGQIKTLEVFDCIGQLQFVQTDNFSDINISSLTSGLYFIVLTNLDNERLTSKIIKE